MKLPELIENKILELIGIPDLNWKSARIHNKKLNRIRTQMYNLADDFAQTLPSADKYSDAYFAYNFPANLMKARVVMQQIGNLYPAVLAGQTDLNICDIGCGEGAGMFGIYYGLENFERIRFTGCDTSLAMLKKCKTMMQDIKKGDTRIHFKLLRQDLSHGLLKKKIDKYNIIVLANSLAEMFTDKAIPVNFIERLLKSCSDNGVIIVLEPATKQLSRRLMILRASIINQGKAQVLLPCLHVEECPLMDVHQQKDWCHQSIAWHAPEYMKIINQGLNREIDRLKFSYLVIAQKDFPRKPINAFLVISSLLREKGKQRCYLCTQQGRIELVRLKRDRSQVNKAFDTIRKSDIIMLDKVIEKRPNYWQVVDNSEIKILNRLTSK
ncbi:MAG: small ribosomal subunit Rsm22 family protein [bacterium]